MTRVARPVAGFHRVVIVVLSMLVVGAGVWTGGTGPAAARATVGYWLVGTDGGVFAFGRAGFFGSVGGIPLNQPIVGMAATPSGGGYWLAASDGGVFAFGDARFFGSLGGQPLNQPIVAVAATPSGGGYWLAASDGGVFAFGDAGFFGSAAGQKLSRPVVDMAVTPSGSGYWLVTSNGAVHAFGDAGFHGAADDRDLVKRIHAVAVTPSGSGYWLVGGDGGVFAFGDARFWGSASGVAAKRVVDLSPSASGAGYYLTTSDGQVFSFGDAVFGGGADELRLKQRIAGMVPANVVEAPQAADDVATVVEDELVVIDVLANDHVPGGGRLRIVSVEDPAHGQATIVSGGIAYQPERGFSGVDSFAYTIADDGGATAAARVVVTVRPASDVPRAVDDEFITPEGSPIRLRVLDNDSGLERGVADVQVVAGPDHGTATVEADWTITYQSEEDFAGRDRFRYRVSDINGRSSEATVRMSVLGDPPVAVNDTATTEPGTPITIDVLSNDQPGGGVDHIEFTHPDGSPHDIGSVPTAAGGKAKRDDGKIRYSPPEALPADGTDSFRYVIVARDGQVSNSATVTVTLTPAKTAGQSTENPAGQPTEEQADGLPTATARPPNAQTDGSPVEFALIGRDDQGPVTFTVLTWPDHGKLTRTDREADCSGPTGACAQRHTYWPDKNFSGRDSFTFASQDTDGQKSKPLTVEIVVKHDQDGPDDTTETPTEATLVPGWLPRRRDRRRSRNSRTGRSRLHPG